MMSQNLKEMNANLIGRTIARVRYDDAGFPVIELDDGSGIWIQRDDECNGPGVAVHVSEGDDGKQIERGTWQL